MSTITILQAYIDYKMVCVAKVKINNVIATFTLQTSNSKP